MLLEIMDKSHWLLKSEPETFSIAHLRSVPKQTTCWDGVRNYQARNFLRDKIKVRDEAFFYHSNANPPGIAGIVKVVKSGYPDPTQFDPKSQYYDKTASRDEPRWYSVDIKLERVFPTLISLEELKTCKSLKDMALLQRSRLSVQPVTSSEWDFILNRFSTG